MRTSVVKTTRNDDNFTFFHLINQTVFSVNSAGPATGKLKPEWFWLAGSIKRSAASFLKKRENAVSEFFVCLQPVAKIV